MSMTWMALAILVIALLAFGLTLVLRPAPAGPTPQVMASSRSRMRTTTIVAAVAGLGFGLWAWMIFPTTYVNATTVPGLLAALGPCLAGLVYLGVTALAEVTWPRPAGQQRGAYLARRPVFAHAVPWAMRAMWIWAGALWLSLITFGLIAEPDGRSLADHDLSGCAENGVAVPCTSGAVGPFPGWPYAVPVMLAALVVVLVTLGVLHLVARRPAVWGTTVDDDQLLRTISATRVVRGSQLALGTTLAGIAYFAGAAGVNAGYWWGLPMIVAAVVILGMSFGLALRRMPV